MSTMAKMRAQMAASSSRSSGSRQSPIRPSSPVAGESSLPASTEQESSPPRRPVVQESAPPCPPAVQNVNDTSSWAPARPMTRQFSHTSSNALTPGRLSRRSSALSSVLESPISPVHKSKGKGKRVDLPKKSKKRKLVSDDECGAPCNAATTSADKKRRVGKESSGKRKGRK